MKTCRETQSQITSAGGVVVRCVGAESFEYLLVGQKPDRSDYWGFPKGIQEPMELLEQTATREILEESGVYARLLALANIVHLPVVRDGKSYQKHIYYYLAYTTREAAAQTDGEFLQVGWFSLEEAYKRLTYPSDRQVLLLVQHYLDTIPLFKHILLEQFFYPDSY